MRQMFRKPLYSTFRPSVATYHNDPPTTKSTSLRSSAGSCCSAAPSRRSSWLQSCLHIRRNTCLFFDFRLAGPRSWRWSSLTNTTYSDMQMRLGELYGCRWASRSWPRACVYWCRSIAAGERSAGLRSRLVLEGGTGRVYVLGLCFLELRRESRV
jgi:hypothetical protein